MRIETDGTNFVIFLNTNYIKNINIDNRDEMIKFIKKILFKLINKSTIFLRGFYKVKVFPNDKLGVFIEIDKQDDFDLAEGIDFRIIINYEDDFLLEFNDYFDTSKTGVIYFDNKFYEKVNSIRDEDIIRKSDLYNIIYGKDVFNVFKYGKRL